MLFLETIETIGFIWLGMSVAAFMLLAASVETRQEVGHRALKQVVRRRWMLDWYRRARAAWLPNDLEASPVHARSQARPVGH